MIRLVFWASFFSVAASAGFAVECQDAEVRGTSYTLCQIDPRREKIQLFYKDQTGDVFGQFAAIDRSLDTRGEHLSFAMNAGMYHDDRAPVGLYIEDDEEIMRVVSSAGPGNFGLLPNGVFCLRDTRADVIETGVYVQSDPGCRSATQSGPMLVIDGNLHPRFLKDGTSRYIRNGVGTSPDGQKVVFAISNEPVNFYDFGLLFRDYLKLPNALYLDGNISRLYAPGISRNDLGFRLGPIVGVVEQSR